MILIGLTGTHGAGKGTVVDYLVREHGFVYVSVSEFLAVEALRRGAGNDRHARANVANTFRAESPTALMEAVYASIGVGEERAILEPLYTKDEVEFIHKKDGIVCSVDAELKVRYARIHKRGSAKDDISFDEFVKKQEEELGSNDPQKQNMRIAMQAADMHLTNSGTVEEFEFAIEKALVERNILL